MKLAHRFTIRFLSAMFACLGYRLPAQQPRALCLSGDIWGAHDPSIIRQAKIW
jgi:hypothetical protein